MGGQGTSQEITVNGDTAHTWSYMQATHVLADDDALVNPWAIYDDRLIRTADGRRSPTTDSSA